MAQVLLLKLLWKKLELRFECLFYRQSKEYKDKYKKVNARIAVSSKFGLTPEI